MWFYAQKHTPYPLFIYWYSLHSPAEVTLQHRVVIGSEMKLTNVHDHRI